MLRHLPSAGRSQVDDLKAELGLEATALRKIREKPAAQALECRYETLRAMHRCVPNSNGEVWSARVLETEWWSVR